jgi:hypothetical protein
VHLEWRNASAASGDELLAIERRLQVSVFCFARLVRLYVLKRLLGSK